MGRSGTQRDVARRRRAEPDPAFVNTATAAEMLGECATTFKNRWDPNATREGGWVYRYGDTRYVIPNCPAGTRRRVPVAHIHAIRNGLQEAS